MLGPVRLTSASTMFDGHTQHILFKGYGVVRPPHDHLYFTWNPRTGLWGGTQLTSDGRHVGGPQPLASEPGALVTRIDVTFLPEPETYAMQFAPVAPTSERSSAAWTALARIKNERRVLPGSYGDSGTLDVRLWPEGFAGEAGSNTLVLPLGPKTPTQLSVTWSSDG